MPLRDPTPEELQKLQSQQSQLRDPTPEELQKLESQEGGILQDVGRSVAGASRAVSDFVTGADRGRGRLPEFGNVPDPAPSEGAEIKTALGMLTTPEVEARKDIIRKNIPGTEFSVDEQGNTVVELPDGRQAFLNAPGLSTQDFLDLGAGILKFLPAAKIAGAGRTVTRRILRGAPAAGATSVAEDVAAQQQGSEQPISKSKAAITAGAGAAAETAAPLVSRAANVFRRSFGRRTQDIIENGQLTPSARRALQRAGIDPDELPPELAESAIELSEQGVAGDVLPGVAQSQRFRFPLTRGQATDDFGQVAREESLRARGDKAGDVVRTFDERQNQRALEITEEIQDELSSGGRRITSEAEGGATLGREVQAQSDDLLLQIDEAYENAAGANATLNRQGLDRLKNAADILDEEGIIVDPELVPSTLRAVERIGSLANKKVTSKTMQELEQLRRQLSSLQGAAKNRTDLKGVTLVKKRLERYLDDAVDNALFSGDENALELIRNARGLRAAYGKRFQERVRRNRSGRKVPDPGGRVVESIVENNPTDEQVVNMIFGRGRLFNPEQAVKAVEAIRRATGESPVVDATLKQLAFRRIADNAIKDGQFSPQKFATAFSKAMKDSPTVMRSIFTKEELDNIRNFRDVAMRTVPPRRATNPSGTSGALTRALGSLGMVYGLQRGGIGFGSLGGRGGRGVGRAIEKANALAQAENAVNPELILPGRPNDATIAGIVSATRQGISE